MSCGFSSVRSVYSLSMAFLGNSVQLFSHLLLGYINKRESRLMESVSLVELICSVASADYADVCTVSHLNQ